MAEISDGVWDRRAEYARDHARALPGPVGDHGQDDPETPEEEIARGVPEDRPHRR